MSGLPRHHDVTDNVDGRIILRRGKDDERAIEHKRARGVDATCFRGDQRRALYAKKADIDHIRNRPLSARDLPGANGFMMDTTCS